MWYTVIMNDSSTGQRPADDGSGDTKIFVTAMLIIAILAFAGLALFG